MSYLEIMEAIKAKYNSDKMKGVTAVYQFELTGDGGGNFHIDVKDGEAEFGDGQHDNPSITVTMEVADFNQLLDGSLNPTTAFMTGKIKVKGDMSLAMKLQALLG